MTTSRTSAGWLGGALVGLCCVRRASRIGGKRLFRVAGLAMAFVAAVTLFNVVHNVEGGGYPIKTPPLALVSREDPDRGWSVEVPSFWISLVQPERVQYEGPLGEVLLIDPAKVALPSGDRLATAGKRIRRRAPEFITSEDNTRIALFRFRVVQSGGSYDLLFKCEARDADAFQDLLQRILESFEVHARPPQQKPLPPKPFQPHGPAA